jgi:hypothetical protein
MEQSAPAPAPAPARVHLFNYKSVKRRPIILPFFSRAK